MKKQLRNAAALLLLAVACKQPAQTSAQNGVNKFSDATLRKIYTLQDERKTQELLSYLERPETMYRREAALAFGSVQDSIAIPALTSLLQDPEADVRKATAYALGQIGSTKVEAALMEAYGKEQHVLTRAEILEAWGKCATQNGLDMIARYTAQPEMQAAQAWAIYRAGQRKLNYTGTIPKAAALLTSGQEEARLGAAHFLGRTAKLDPSPAKVELFKVVQQDPSANVRMAAALALSKMTDTAGVAPVVNAIFRKEADYRVRINAVRALYQLPYAAVQAAAWNALSDKHPHVALSAAEYLTAKAPAEEANRLLEAANKQKDWRVRATLFGAALASATQKQTVGQQIQQRFAAAKNPYEKAALLTALSKDQANSRFIEQQTFQAAHPAISTSGMEALAAIRGQKNFDASTAPVFSSIFQKAIQSGDVALVGIAAGAIRNPDLNMKNAYADRAFLIQARDKLTLPRDIETYLELQKTLDYLEGKTSAPTPATPFSHPINWATVNKLQKNQKIRLQTSKGDITFELLVEDAPGSVANFVELLEKGFYNGKNYHRVVPNFVAQGGCPRGDGWGSTDYAIRSELADLNYLEGYVGMASAGKDTESCQWFITHSPTPHLDGKYTIFARVVKGMDVVHRLNIGDAIEKVELVR
ncbi:peptidylprolyl isomerase [Rufibacter sediminis]|uniref:peptidylprolyl isomerase n=1 Tax=Rufibacter sediminis TaxID=2762756 RepID=A0ABR6VSA8_9BACT|nr:peptidylprolyl isomerase [Rufibacter sediminis]MBC3540064.1 peptidylprolyl isomerase [Rufibacter sediminis]